jgi:hypothetical protein
MLDKGKAGLEVEGSRNVVATRLAMERVFLVWDNVVAKTGHHNKGTQQR